jgi:2-oxoglutarate ferredoxin oxidoreductase subunit delta
MPRRDAVLIDDGECRGCGLCVLACPAGCLAFADEFNALGYHPVRYSGEGCRGDGLCSAACPRPGAILLVAVQEAPTLRRHL